MCCLLLFCDGRRGDGSWFGFGVGWIGVVWGGRMWFRVVLCCCVVLLRLDVVWSGVVWCGLGSSGVIYRCLVMLCSVVAVGGGVVWGGLVWSGVVLLYTSVGADSGVCDRVRSAS